MTSKDVSNWQATQNQMLKAHFSPSSNLKRNFARKGIKRHLQAMDGCQGSILPSIGGVLGLHVVFCAGNNHSPSLYLLDRAPRLTKKVERGIRTPDLLCAMNKFPSLSGSSVGIARMQATPPPSRAQNGSKSPKADLSQRIHEVPIRVLF